VDLGPLETLLNQYTHENPALPVVQMDPERQYFLVLPELLECLDFLEIL
jgi:hypothetical protein